MTEQVEKPESRPLDADTRQGTILAWVELVVVCLVTLAALGVGIYLIAWIAYGHWYGNGSHERLARTIRGMHENWRVCLLLLIVLFFRPMRKFLINLKEGPFGIKTGDQLPAVPSANPTTKYPSHDSHEGG